VISAKTTLGQTAMIPGPKKANIFPKPTVVAAMVKKSKRCLLVVGSKAPFTTTKDGNLVDSAIRMSKNGNISVAATGHIIKEFLKRGSKSAFSIQVMNLGDRLRDPSWGGFDGAGIYDLVIFAGFAYYIEWLVQSGLKNFAPDLRIISLEKTYQPNASWSLGTLPEGRWEESLDEILTALEENKS